MIQLDLFGEYQAIYLEDRSDVWEIELSIRSHWNLSGVFAVLLSRGKQTLAGEITA